MATPTTAGIDEEFPETLGICAATLRANTYIAAAVDEDKLERAPLEHLECSH